MMTRFEGQLIYYLFYIFSNSSGFFCYNRKMSNNRKNYISTPIVTPYGTLHVWANETTGRAKDHPDGLVFFEVDKEEGGLTLPSGRTYYTTTKYGNWAEYFSFWSPTSGFLTTELNLLYEENGKEKQLENFDPDMVIISDLFFDLFLNCFLPQIPTELVQVYLDNQTTINEWCSKMYQTEQLIQEINKLARDKNILLAKKHNIRSMGSAALPRVRYKYL
jgi:hypothetical protein